MVDEHAAGKVAPRLAERIDAPDSRESVEVIIELHGATEPTAAGSRQQRIAEAKSSFEHDLAAVTRSIQAVGGEVLESAWLNKTLRGRIPADQVARVAEDDAVAVIDLPRAIEPD